MARQHRRQGRDNGQQIAGNGSKTAMLAAVGLAVAAAVAPSGARADAIIGDWEGTTDGWIDWSNGQAPIAAPKFSYDTIGVTSGSQSLKLTQVGWGQNLSLKLQLFSNGVK